MHVHNYLACTFADLDDPCDPASTAFTHVCLVHANFTSHTTSSPLPSPPTHAWLTSSSPHPIRPSPHYLPSSHIFLSLLLLKRKWWRLYFRDHDKLIQTNRSSGHCTRIFILTISKPCAEARSPVHHNLNSLHSRCKACLHTNPNTCAMLTRFITS